MIATRALLLIPAAFLIAACSSERTPDLPLMVKVEKPFAAGGSIVMQLEGGNYTLKAASGPQIRVSFAGNVGNAAADLSAEAAQANLTIKDTPHNNFQAVIEVPATSDLTVRLSGGNLNLDGIAGNKDLDAKAGNINIGINKDDYASVTAEVKAGNINAPSLGKTASGLAPSLNWTGSGKYKLHASLGAGNLEFKP